MLIVQTILVPKKFTLSQAKKEVTKRGYEVKKIDKTKNYYRFRQIDPDPTKDYYTISLKNGIKVVYQR